MKQFAYVQESSEFLSLFPHRGSYLWADHPAPGDSPQWQCETRHLLSDRLIEQAAYLYGVRFGPETNYLLLDIDRRSIHHPYRNPAGIQRIVELLEPLGLSRYIAVSSSYSGGLHLYFPFNQSQISWALASAAQALLKGGGCTPIKGQLELFPNPRRAVALDYNGHRLPLQDGSFILDGDWQPAYSSRDRFCQLWRWAAESNDVRREIVDRILLQSDRHPYRRLRHSAQKFLNDLNAEIERGWTGFGQTNHLLGRIAMRCYIFNHVIYGGEPLTGSALASEIADIAESLPGYHQFCRHQAEIAKLSLYWARTIEASDYYPYGRDAVKLKPPDSPSWNERQAAAARGRIVEAIERLLQSSAWPEGARARFQALKAAGIGSDALYKNLLLWHPDFEPKAAPGGMFPPVEAGSPPPRSPEAAPGGVFPPVGPISLESMTAEPPPSGSVVDSPNGGRGGFSTGQDSPPGPALIQGVLSAIKARRRRVIAPPDSNPPPDERWFERAPGRAPDESR